MRSAAPQRYRILQVRGHGRSRNSSHPSSVVRTLTSENLFSRWTSRDFQATVWPAIESLMTKRQLVGPVDLRGMTVGLIGQIQELSNFDFQDIEIEGVDLSFSRFSCSFSRCAITACDLEKAKFDTCRMVFSKFYQTNFRGVNISAPLANDALFEACDFSGSRLRGRGAKAYGARRAEFRDCVFDQSQFVGLELRACRFIDCKFENTVFEKCVLAGTKFTGAAPTGRILSPVMAPDVHRPP